MSDAVAVAIIAALSLLATSALSTFAIIYNAKHVAVAVAQKVDASAVAVAERVDTSAAFAQRRHDETDAKTEHIRELVNSNYAKLQQERDTAMRRAEAIEVDNAKLHQQLEDLALKLNEDDVP